VGSNHNFETRPSESTRDPADSGLEQGRVEDKIGKGKPRYDPATQLTRRPSQKPGCNPLTFVFLTKTMSF
jgi:hypothetical protein